MDFKIVERGVGSNKQLIKQVLIARNRTASFTILVIIIGLKGNGKVYSHKKARGIGASRDKRIFIYITLILPN